MPLNSVRLIVSDMDGTLLNSSHLASDLFFKQFDELQKLGIEFVAASGRQYDSIKDKIAPIADQITIVAENGAFAKTADKIIITTQLPELWKADVIPLLKQNKDIHAVFCAPQNAYMSIADVELIDKVAEYYFNLKKVDALEKIEDTIVKIALFHPESAEQYIYPLVQRLEPKFKVKVSGKHWVDLSHPKAHKGYAIDKIQNDLGISRAQTMVFGDYHNDIEMLQLADYSYAMGNAHPDIVKIANYQTTSNDDLGVERVIAQLLEARRKPHL